VSNYLASYDLFSRGRKTPQKLACIVQAQGPKEARKKVLDKQRGACTHKDTDRVARLRISRLS
jgi:hypothetical protein